MTNSQDKEFEELISRMDAEELALFSIKAATVQRHDEVFSNKLYELTALGRRELGEEVDVEFENLTMLTGIVPRFEKNAWGKLYALNTLRGDKEAISLLNDLVVRRLSH